MSKITVTGHTGRDIVFESEYGHCMISQEVEIIDAPSTLYGYEEQDIVLVSDLHVRPEYRRKGHGRVLLRAAIAYVKRKFPHLPLKILLTSTLVRDSRRLRRIPLSAWNIGDNNQKKLLTTFLDSDKVFSTAREKVYRNLGMSFTIRGYTSCLSATSLRSLRLLIRSKV